MNMPLVSVIIPAFNCQKFIGQAMDSVLAQTYTAFEVVVVDDSSTDGTDAVVKAYAAQDARIIYERLEKNSGAAVARTRAMELARGRYMAFLDADDLWLPQKLEKQIDFMRKTGCSFSCTSYDQVDEANISLNKVVRSLPRTDYKRLLLDCPVGNSTVMYDVEAMGKFRVPDIRKRNDDALWLCMLKKEQYIVGMPEVLTHYRVRKDSISAKKLQLIRYHWILYRKIEKLSIPTSVFHILYWCGIKVLHLK